MTLLATPPVSAAPATPPVRRSLQQVLRRALLAVAVMAVLLAGCLLILFGGLVLRSQTTANLQLVARSVSYTLEAAIVFHDQAAASEAVALIVDAEDVSQAWVYDEDGRLLVRWSRPAATPWSWLQAHLAAALLPPSVEVPVRHGRVTIGRVVLRSAGGGLVGFVLGGAAAILACLLLSALAAASAMQRVLGKILAPLRELTAVARSGRIERSLDRRVPAARIAEFHELGEDVNALLAELQARQQGLQQENAHLSLQASTDSLTGLHNRGFFESRLAGAIARAEASGGHLAVMFLDGDGFKQINDRHGHEAGDLVLVAIASRIRRPLREQDVVARMGGDEFAVLLDGLHGRDDARRVAEAIFASMAEPLALHGGASVRVSVSIGTAFYPEDARDAADLMRQADAAMYAAKRA
ncbi:diguanylate cyclase [Xylophilus rhododendri]|uniref:Diguanylate cyclase n=1 Tax=Xylophilus rhododendri TaxID=2697032 RepID=A0A857J4N9_9BURK|nr:sensor domain-containing diguanylate cyclase [Xylophilus rhododendri]QHI98647.1 diguanylate cyclase [Xylophilus rhododendri]